METLNIKRTYRDNAEIESAWKELIQALQPVLKKEKDTVKITKHHPALLTTSDLAHWEMIG